MLFHLNYVLSPKYLYIRGGPFSVRIRYENITKIKKKKKQVKL
ncbi:MULTISPECIES: PH domain-containing protein [Oceanobacillus]